MRLTAFLIVSGIAVWAQNPKPATQKLAATRSAHADAGTVPPPPTLPGQRAAVNTEAPKSLGGEFRFADPSAILVGSLDVSALAKSTLVRSLVEQFTSQLQGGVPAVRTAFNSWIASGTIRRVSFSLSGPDSKVMLVEGRAEQRDLDLWSQGAKLRAVRLGTDRFLVGDAQAVTAALGRWRAVQTKETTLVHQGRSLVKGADLWLAAGGPVLAMSGLAEAPKGLAMGVGLSDGLQLQVAIDAGSAQAAQKMLADMEAKIKTQTPETAEVSAKVEGTAIRVNVAFDAEKLQQVVAARFTPEMRQQVTAFVDAQKPKPKKAMIYGLDDGPREVILSRP